MSLRFLPNLLCILRILLVYPVAQGILVGDYPRVLALIALAAFTDGLDGYLAKQFGWHTELGKVLDPLADKLLLVTVFVCLSLAGRAPGWLAGLVVLRDLVIFIGALVYKWLFGPLQGRPTVASKLNTLCQILFCLAVVADAAFGMPGTSALIGLGALAFVTTAVSGIDYVLIYSRRAAAVTRGRATAAG